MRDSQFHSPETERAEEEQLTSQLLQATQELGSHSQDVQLQLLKVGATVVVWLQKLSLPQTK